MSNPSRKLVKSDAGDRRKYEGVRGHVKGVLALHLQVQERELKAAKRAEARRIAAKGVQ